jgi:hypothetical protein
MRRSGNDLRLMKVTLMLAVWSAISLLALLLRAAHRKDLRGVRRCSTKTWFCRAGVAGRSVAISSLEVRTAT